MSPEVRRQIDELSDLSVAELRERYAVVFGEPTHSRHKRHLQKRIAWKLQANEQGGLSERALRRAKELARDADLRLVAPKSGRPISRKTSPPPDHRLPMPGTVLTREHRGRVISATVLDDGFEYDGEVYKSLSAVARAATGTRWNGFLFFGLTKRNGT